ncbi:MAG TPA: ABC transporter substrate-binding protein [Paucimonas sp.]|nr:ABC transporter substrate-binding protein [Paucimonas sp.]
MNIGLRSVGLRSAKLIAGLLCGLALHIAAYAKADPNKVIRVSFEASEDGFDLTRTNNLYSTWMCDGIFESLLTYDYLARPAKLVPYTAEAMPEISADGKTYTFRLKKGIYFTPDPAFKGQKRELVAADYAYVIKRHMDPKTRSVQEGNFRGKIVGLDALAEQAKKTGKFDYDAPVAGLEAVDRYTLRIRLNAPDYTLLYYLANATTGALAREVVEHYGADIGRHPVGTGAYMLKQYVPRSKIILEANPDYRGFVWDFKSSGEAWDEQVIRDMKGKHMPQIGRVEISVIEEEQARWLAFDSQQLDLEQMAPPAAPKVLDGDKLKPQFTARGIKLYRYIQPATRYTFFNFKDPVVGGYTKDKIALRRAIAMAYNAEEEIRQVWYGQAVKAQSTIPPGLAGYDPKYRTSIGYDPELAAKLLDHFGYKKGADGWRTMPDGKPLVIKIHSAPKSRDVAKMEVWKRSLDRINLRTEFPVAGFADNLKAAYQCELSMWGLGGTAGIPDGLEFVQSYYGPSAYQGNFGCYQSNAFDEAYKQAALMPDSPERTALYQRMLRIMEADTTEVLELWQIRNWLTHPWVKGYKKHPIVHGDWQYLDIEKH